MDDGDQPIVAQGAGRYVAPLAAQEQHQFVVILVDRVPKLGKDVVPKKDQDFIQRGGTALRRQHNAIQARMR